MYSFSACELAPTAKDYGLLGGAVKVSRQVVGFLGVLLFCCPSGMGFRRLSKLGRLPGAGQRGPARGCARLILMPNHALRVWAAIGGTAAGRKGTDISR